RYRIEALIGAGGMGAVYRAEHVHMKKTIAVKVLHRDMMLNPEVVARFEREAVAGGRIDHPHVASAIDFGRLDSGVFYLPLEFVEGRGLRQVLRQEGPFPEQRALTIAWQSRSEEHTSELQSREKLVCRLLVENNNMRVFTV